MRVAEIACGGCIGCIAVYRNAQWRDSIGRMTAFKKRNAQQGIRLRIARNEDQGLPQEGNRVGIVTIAREA